MYDDHDTGMRDATVGGTRAEVISAQCKLIRTCRALIASYDWNACTEAAARDRGATLTRKRTGTSDCYITMLVPL